MRTPGKILLLIGSRRARTWRGRRRLRAEEFQPRAERDRPRAERLRAAMTGRAVASAARGWRVPGVIMTVPGMLPPGGPFIDDDDVISNNGPPRRQRSARRGPSGAPPAGERRLVPDEVVIEVRNSVSATQIDALAAAASADPPRVANVPAVRHHFVPLAHSRPPLGRRRWCARSSATASSPRRSRIICSRCRQDDAAASRGRTGAIRARQAASAAGACARQRRRRARGGDRFRRSTRSTPELAGSIAGELRHAHGTDGTA